MLKAKYMLTPRAAAIVAAIVFNSQRLAATVPIKGVSNPQVAALKRKQILADAAKTGLELAGNIVGVWRGDLVKVINDDTSGNYYVRELQDAIHGRQVTETISIGATSALSIQTLMSMVKDAVKSHAKNRLQTLRGDIPRAKWRLKELDKVIADGEREANSARQGVSRAVEDNRTSLDENVALAAIGRMSPGPARRTAESAITNQRNNSYRMTPDEVAQARADQRWGESWMQRDYPALVRERTDLRVNLDAMLTERDIINAERLAD